MPTYDYKCDACGHAFERFQSITAAPIRKCPDCGRSKARRLIGTGAGLIFKGSGFYITDYRSESYKSAAKNESGTAKTDSAAKTDGVGKSDGAGASKNSGGSGDAKTSSTSSKTEARSSAKSSSGR